MLRTFPVWVCFMLLASTPVLAQDCALDLTQTISLLESAQDAADAGSAAEAVDLMIEARTILEALSAECMVVETPDIDLSQSYTLDTEFGSLSFDYPDGWLTQRFDQNRLMLGNRASAFELDLRMSGLSPIESGNVLIAVGAVDLDYFGQSSLGSNTSPLQVLESMAEPSGLVLTTSGDPVELVVNDRPAASLVLQGNGTAVNYLLVKLAIGIDGPIFGEATLITATDEREDYEAVLTAVAESFHLEPV
jgi:hypothetical protein